MLPLPLRRAIYITFILGFLITAPILVLYTAGYRYNFKKSTVQKVGSISVKPSPSEADIYLDDKRFFPVYKIAGQNKIPIFVHSQIVNPIGYERVQDPLLTPVIEYVFDTTISIGKLLMADILRDYQNLKFIFAYFGGVITHLEHRFDATYQMLRGINFVKDLKAKPTDYLRNIYVDTSGDIKKTNFLSALELLGPKHILWGSDWPAKKDIASSINAVKNLDISAQDKEDILGGNLEKILS